MGGFARGEVGRRRGRCFKQSLLSWPWVEDARAGGRNQPNLRLKAADRKRAIHRWHDARDTAWKGSSEALWRGVDGEAAWEAGDIDRRPPRLSAGMAENRWPSLSVR